MVESHGNDVLYADDKPSQGWQPGLEPQHRADHKALTGHGSPIVESDVATDRVPAVSRRDVGKGAKESTRTKQGQGTSSESVSLIAMIESEVGLALIIVY